MPSKSKADRTREILYLNPSLRADDTRIAELFAAEGLLRKAQRAAKGKPVLTQTAAGNERRSPVWVEVDKREEAVRRLRNQVGIDRVAVKQAERAGVKRKRSAEADRLIALYGEDYAMRRALHPNIAAFLSAHGIVADDLPEPYREAFESDLAEQAEHVQPIAERIRQYK